MNIDFDRLILLMLPIRLRTVRLFAILRILISEIAKLYNAVLDYINIQRRRIAATPQAIVIEYLVTAETGIDVQITTNEINASPDIIINYPASSSAEDIKAVESVVNRYKLSGMYYRTNGTAIPFTHEWSDYRCIVEEQRLIESHEWSDYRCNIIAAELPICVLHMYISSNGIVWVEASDPVKSAMNLSVNFYNDVLNGGQESHSFFIPVDGSVSNNMRLSWGTSRFVTWALESIDPEQDEFYQYSFNANI